MSFKNILKRAIAGVVLLSQFVTVCHAFENQKIDYYDEYIKISGTLKAGAENDVVTLVILDKAIDFTSFDIINDSETASHIKMYYETKLDSGGNYTFYFAPDNGGRYYGYINTESNGDVSHKFPIPYIIKEDFDALKVAFDGTADALKNVLYTNRNALGLTVPIYSELAEGDYLDIAKILKSAGFSRETFIDVADKAALIVNLNKNAINDINSYIDILNLSDKNAEYFNEEISKDVTKNLSGKNIVDMTQFDSVLTESIILANINNASAEKIMKVLKDYGIGINISVANSLKKAAPYTSLDDVKNDIKKYSSTGTTQTTSTGGGGGGGGGSSWPNVKNNFQGAVIEQAPIETIANFAFDDLDEVLWAKEAVEELYKMGVISGKEARLFYPKDKVLREEFAKIIATAFELNLIDNEFPFSDVSEQDWFYPYVKSAYLAGIVKGIGEDTFGAGRTITREDLCVMIYRAVEVGNYTLSGNISKSFDDAEDISEYAKEAVARLVSSGIISGDDNNKFNPKASATRAEAARIVYMTLQKIR